MRQMTSKERCIAVMNGEVADFIPIIPQAFMFAIEFAGMKTKDVNHSGLNMAKAHAITQEKYGYDGCVIDFDDATVAEAIGAKVLFRDNDPATVDEHNPFWKSLKDVYQTPMPNLLSSGRICHWLEATSRLNEMIGDSIYIMGRADQGPFAVACLLRGTENFMMDLLTEDRQVISDAIEFCRQVGVAFAKLQKDAGAHITSIGDALAGPNLISPDMYKEFAWAPERDYAREVQAYGIPLSLHICGNATDIVAMMGETESKVIEIDWAIDMKMAREVLPETTVLMGNINPSDPLVLGSPTQIEAQVKQIIEGTKGKGLFMSSGCAMGRNTPAENLVAMVEATRKYGSYEQVMELLKGK